MVPLATVLTSSSSTTVIKSGSLGIRTTEEEADSTSPSARSRRMCEGRFDGVSGTNPIVGATQHVLKARVDTSRLFVRTMVISILEDCVQLDEATVDCWFV